jgi:hypothetical protein
MGPKTKVAVFFLFIAILGLGLWYLTSPPSLPPVGTKYVNSDYASRGSWIIGTKSSAGRAYLGFGIANLTYPRPYLSTTYSLVISIVNETITASYVKSYGLRVTNLFIQDNYDGNATRWGKASNLSDAAQATSLLFFKTSATHELRFTVTYQLYDVLLFGYITDHAETQSFNITQTVV